MRLRPLVFVAVLFVSSLLTSSVAQAAVPCDLFTTSEAYWNEVRQVYPIIPPVIVEEFQPPDFAVAYYLGLTADGQHARISVRSDLCPSRSTIWHEAGHAYEDVLTHGGTQLDDLRTLYWAMRGFPGTWQTAQMDAIETRRLGGGAFAVWRLLPMENWAETFKAANLPGQVEFTETYGVPLDQPKMLGFFLSLQRLQPLRYVSYPFPVTTDGNGNADTVIGLSRLFPYRPTVVLVQRVGTTGTERTVPHLTGQSVDGLTATIRVRGDWVRNGEIWLQVVALQGSVSDPISVRTDSRGNADLSGLPLTGTVAGRPTIVFVERVGTTGTERVLPGLSGQSTDGVTATVRVRGDYIRGGTVWIQLVAIQPGLSLSGVSSPSPVSTDGLGDADTIRFLSGTAIGSNTIVFVQRVGTTGVEGTVPGLVGQTDDGFSATVRVRGDSIHNGIIWLQVWSAQ